MLQCLIYCLAALPLLGTPGVYGGEDSQAPMTAEEASSTSIPESGDLDLANVTDTAKLSLHGYFTQAYAWSDGNQILGIPESGTGEYRNLALQLGYQINERHRMIVQLSHEKLGKSPGDEFAKELELDWALYEYRVLPQSELKIGRIQVPFGLFNEVRDVGTIIPFFRIPNTVYGETSSVSETVDGMAFSHRFAAGSPWNLDVDLYYGRWDFLHLQRGQLAEAQAKDAMGVSLWLGMPIDSIRFGVGAMRFDRTGGFRLPGVRDPQENLIFSFQLDLERFDLHAEFLRAEGTGRFTGYYVHGGVILTPRLSLHAQAEFADLDLDIPFYGPLHVDLVDEIAISLVSRLWRTVTLKTEYHWNEGYGAEDPQYSIFGEPQKTEFGIVSLAFSF